MIHIVLADDHHLVRQGIRALLEKEDDLEVVGEAVDGREAADLVLRLVPDVLVMDIAMPKLNGIKAAQLLQEAGCPTRIVILSMYTEDFLVQQALKNGAKGFLPKGSVAEELLLAVRAASRGAVYLSPAISSTAFKPAATAPGSIGQLTPRELQLLQLISEGNTNNQMAELLRISVKTVERHRTKLMAKLKVRNLVELMRVAIKHQLIRLHDWPA